MTLAKEKWFDGRVSLGNLLSIGTVIVGLSVGWAQLDARMAGIEKEQVRIAAGERQNEDRIRALEVGFASTTSEIRSIAAMLTRIESKVDKLAERTGQ